MISYLKERGVVPLQPITDIIGHACIILIRFPKRRSELVGVMRRSRPGLYKMAGPLQYLPIASHLIS